MPTIHETTHQRQLHHPPGGCLKRFSPCWWSHVHPLQGDPSHHHQIIGRCFSDTVKLSSMTNQPFCRLTSPPPCHQFPFHTTSPYTHHHGSSLIRLLLGASSSTFPPSWLRKLTNTLVYPESLVYMWQERTNRYCISPYRFYSEASSC